MSSDIKLNDDHLLFEGYFKVNDLFHVKTGADGELKVTTTGEVRSTGSEAGFSFADRNDPNQRRVWRCESDGTTCLWSEETNVNLLIINKSGDLLVERQILAKKGIATDSLDSRASTVSEYLKVGHIESGTPPTAIQAFTMIEPGRLHANGPEAALSFADRNKNYVESPTHGQRWEWRCEGGTARLWSGNDKLEINHDGDVKAKSAHFETTVVQEEFSVMSLASMITGNPQFTMATPGSIEMCHAQDSKTSIKGGHITVKLQYAKPLVTGRSSGGRQAGIGTLHINENIRGNLVRPETILGHQLPEYVIKTEEVDVVMELINLRDRVEELEKELKELKART